MVIEIGQKHTRKDNLEDDIQILSDDLSESSGEILEQQDNEESNLEEKALADEGYELLDSASIHESPQTIEADTRVNTGLNWRAFGWEILYSAFIYLIASCDGILAAADMGKSNYEYSQQEGEDILPITLILTIAVTYFSAIGLNFAPMRENMDESIEIIKTGYFPNNWAYDKEKQEEWSPSLSPTLGKLALGIAAIPTAWLIAASISEMWFFGQGVEQDYHFLPDTKFARKLWNASLIGMAAGVGLTKFLTESIEFIKTIRRLMTRESSQYTNRFSAIVSPFFGGALGMLSSLEQAMQDYIACKMNFGIKSRSFGMWLVASLSLMISVPNFCFAGVFCINSLDDFFGYLSKRKIEPVKFVSFTLALSLSAYQSYYKRYLNKFFYLDVLNEVNSFGYQLNPKEFETTFEAVSWFMFTEDTIKNTASLYWPMYNIMLSLGTRIENTARRVKSIWKSPEATPLLESASQPIIKPTNENQRPGRARPRIQSTAILIPAYREGHTSTFYQPLRQPRSTNIEMQSKLSQTL